MWIAEIIVRNPSCRYVVAVELSEAGANEKLQAELSHLLAANTAATGVCTEWEVGE